MKTLPLAFLLTLLPLAAIAQDQPAFEEPITSGDTPPDLSVVIDIFAKTFAETCAWGLGGETGGIGPEVYELTYAESWDEPGTPEHPYRLYEFNCDAGAYNFQMVYLGWDESSGLRPLLFAQPTLDIQYGEAAEDGEPPLESISIIGYSAYPTITNASFDPDTKTLMSSAKWRGIGDASSNAFYELVGTEFVLKVFDVDPTYDGEVNPIRVVDLSGPAEVPLVILPDSVETSVTSE